MKRFEPLPDEEVIIVNPKHWKNYILPVFLIIFNLALITIIAKNPGLFQFVNSYISGKTAKVIAGILPAAITVMCGIVIIMAIVNIIDTCYTRYYITDKRIVSISGVIHVTVAEMLLEKCETVSLSQRFTERLFNSGDILCISAGSSIYLDDVYDARKFKQTIINMLTNQNN